MAYSFENGVLVGQKVKHKTTPNKNSNGTCRPEIKVINDNASSQNKKDVID